MIGLWRRWRRARVLRQRTAGMVGKIGCDVCQQEEAVHAIPSRIENRDVFMCDFCFRRWRRANQQMAIPKTRKRKKVGR